VQHNLNSERFSNSTNNVNVARRSGAKPVVDVVRRDVEAMRMGQQQQSDRISATRYGAINSGSRCRKGAGTQE
jgi:hypothetical protein